MLRSHRAGPGCRRVGVGAVAHEPAAARLPAVPQRARSGQRIREDLASVVRATVVRATVGSHCVVARIGSPRILARVGRPRVVHARVRRTAVGALAGRLQHGEIRFDIDIEHEPVCHGRRAPHRVRSAEAAQRDAGCRVEELDRMGRVPDGGHGDDQHVADERRPSASSMVMLLQIDVPEWPGAGTCLTVAAPVAMSMAAIFPGGRQVSLAEAVPI